MLLMEAGRTESPVVHRHTTGEREKRREGSHTSGLTLQGAALGDAAEQRWVGSFQEQHGRAPGRGQHDRAIKVAGIAKADDAAIGPPIRGRNQSHVTGPHGTR